MRFFRGASAVEIVTIRLDPGEEVRSSLNRVVNELQLAAGALIAGSGTLDRIALETPTTLTYPPAVYATEKTGPGQIVAAQGLIVDGAVNAALTVARRTEIFSGVVMDGCTVLHTAQFVLLRAGNTRWVAPPDAQSGVPTLEAIMAPSAAAVSLMGKPVDVAAVALVPSALIRKHQALPVAKTADTLVVAMPDPNNPFAIDDLRAATGLRIQAVAVPPAELLRAIAEALGGRG